MPRASNNAAAAFAVVAIAAWFWLAMMLTHELGHVLAAWATGGVITSVELRPGRLSHTLVSPNPAPAVVLWSGFWCGWLAPLITAPLWRCERGLTGPALRAWVGFCWLAGGAYLALGAGESFSDTGQLVEIGQPLLLLITIGVGVAAAGYAWSRGAWIAIARRLAAAPIGWRVGLGWWAWLGLWWLAQSGLHQVLVRRE